MKFNLKRLILPALALLLVASVSLYADIEDTQEKSFNVESGGKLVLDTELGSVEVKSHDRDRVDVLVVSKARTSDKSKAGKLFADLEVNFEKSGNDVLIDADYEGSKSWSLFGGKTRLNVKFIVTVPKKYDLDIKTSGGSIKTEEITGFVKAKTSGGSLSFQFIDGKVWGKTSGGSIKLEGCSGDADVRTSGGSIRIGKVKGDVKAHTSGGSIKVKEVMGILDAHTSGGSISAYISEQPKGDCSLKSSGGSITVSLAADIAVDLEARTSGGRVHTEFPYKGKIKYKLSTKINGGGPLLEVKTSGGGIYIKKID